MTEWRSDAVAEWRSGKATNQKAPPPVPTGGGAASSRRRGSSRGRTEHRNRGLTVVSFPLRLADSPPPPLGNGGGSKRGPPAHPYPNLSKPNPTAAPHSLSPPLGKSRTFTTFYHIFAAVRCHFPPRSRNIGLFKRGVRRLLSYARSPLSYARSPLSYARRLLPYARTHLSYARRPLPHARTHLPYARSRPSHPRRARSAARTAPPPPQPTRPLRAYDPCRRRGKGCARTPLQTTGTRQAPHPPPPTPAPPLPRPPIRIAPAPSPIRKLEGGHETCGVRLEIGPVCAKMAHTPARGAAIR